MTCTYERMQCFSILNGLMDQQIGFLLQPNQLNTTPKDRFQLQNNCANKPWQTFLYRIHLEKKVVRLWSNKTVQYLGINIRCLNAECLFFCFSLSFLFSLPRTVIHAAQFMQMVLLRPHNGVARGREDETITKRFTYS